MQHGQAPQPGKASSEAASRLLGWRTHPSTRHQRLQSGGGVGAEQLLHGRRAAARRDIAQRAHQRDEQRASDLLVLKHLHLTRSRGSTHTHNGGT